MKISFNDQEVKKMSKSQFLKAFAKAKRAIDLEAYYDSLFPKKKKKSVKGDS